MQCERFYMVDAHPGSWYNSQLQNNKSNMSKRVLRKQKRERNQLEYCAVAERPGRLLISFILTEDIVLAQVLSSKTATTAQVASVASMMNGQMVCMRKREDGGKFSFFGCGLTIGTPPTR